MRRIALLIGPLLALQAADAADVSPTSLQRPADVREYVFLTSGLGMAYGPARDAAGRGPAFTNVFVNPQAYRAFMQSGVWPDGTTFLLEVRRSAAHVSIDVNGQTQSTAVALEAAVKDTRKYPDGGWAYFSFGTADRVEPLPRTAECYSCHRRHGAVEWTFTQFYPDQFEVAKRLGTVRSDYDPEETAR